MALNNNSLLIKPLDSELQKLSGKFRFDNGNLQSDPLSATWFGQPVAVNFSTQEGARDYKIDVGLKGDWQPGKFPGLPKEPPMRSAAARLAEPGGHHAAASGLGQLRYRHRRGFEESEQSLTFTAGQNAGRGVAGER